MAVLGFVLILLGAIVTFGITADLGGVDTDSIGFVLMAGGVVVVLFGLISSVRRGPETSPSPDTSPDTSPSGSGSVRERLAAFPRMVHAVRRHQYGGLTLGKLRLMALGVVYLVSPIDVVPDLLPVIGVVDDMGVLVWLVSSALQETGRFITWERGRPEIVPDRTSP